MRTPTKFSQDIVPLSDMKVNPGRIVHEAESEERAFLRGVVQGLMGLEEGRETDLSAVKLRLGLP
jgi:hypothetical protein